MPFEMMCAPAFDFARTAHEVDLTDGGARFRAPGFTLGLGSDIALETQGKVWIDWKRMDGLLELSVEDEGPGLPDTSNLFVPFFTTKPQGSGIGLALSRQIAEAHGGTLSLENRHDARGCRAVLLLPLQ